AAHQRRQQSRPSPFLQIRPLRYGEPERGFLGSPPFCEVVCPVHANAFRIRVSAAGGHFLFHLPVVELHDRFLPGKRAAGAESPAFRDLRLLLPATHGRSDRTRQTPPATVPSVPPCSPPEFHGWRVAVSRRLVQETGPGDRKST